jgi:hypothetical protein
VTETTIYQRFINAELSTPGEQEAVYVVPTGCLALIDHWQCYLNASGAGNAIATYTFERPSIPEITVFYYNVQFPAFGQPILQNPPNSQQALPVAAGEVIRASISYDSGVTAVAECLIWGRLIGVLDGFDPNGTT